MRMGADSKRKCDGGGMQLFHVANLQRNDILVSDEAGLDPRCLDSCGCRTRGTHSTRTR